MKMWLYAAETCIGLGKNCAWAGTEIILTRGQSEGWLHFRMFVMK